MSQIKEVFLETIENNPDLHSEELTDIIIGNIAEQIPEKLSAIDIPDKDIRFGIAKGRMFRSRLKKRDRNIKKEKEKEKIDLINSILILQSETQVENIGDNLSYIPNEEFMHPHMFTKFIHENKSLIDYENPVDNLIPSRKDVDVVNKSKYTSKNKQSSLYDAVKIANSLSDKINSYELTYDEVYDKLLNIEVNLDAKDALDLWLGILERLDSKYKKELNIEWTGEFNISTEDFIEYSVRIMIESGNGPKSVDGFDAITAVREGRD